MLGFGGILIIPKGLINGSGWIAILFGSFLDPPKMRPNIDPVPYLLPKYFNEYNKIMETLSKHICFVNLGTSHLEDF